MDSSITPGMLLVPRTAVRSRAIEFAFFVVLAPALLLALLWLPLKAGGLGTSADFIQFYGVGRIIRAGHAPQIYNYAYQAASQREFTTNTEPMIFNHPPFEALLFAPLAWLTYPAAFAVWSWFSLSILGLVFFLLQGYGRALTLTERLTLLGCAMIPAIACLMQGQDSFLILLAYVLAFLGLKSRRDFGGGCALTLGLLKPQLVIPFVLVMLVRRKYKFVAGFCSGGGILLAASLLFVGLPGVVGYARMIPQMGGITGQDAFHIFPAAMPNVRGFLYFLLGTRLSARMIAWFTVAASVALLFWTIGRTGALSIDTPETFDLEFCSIVVFTLLVSYHMLVHDLTLLLLPAFLLLVQSAVCRWQWAHVILASIAVEEFILMATGFKWYSVVLPAILVLGFAINERPGAPPSDC